MKIAQSGLPFSPNLGDGVIAERLAHVIAAAAPDAEVLPFDLSGRTEFDELIVANRSLALKVLSDLLLRLRQNIIDNRLNRVLSRVPTMWTQALLGGDPTIICGF